MSQRSSDEFSLLEPTTNCVCFLLTYLERSNVPPMFVYRDRSKSKLSPAAAAHTWCLWFCICSAAVDDSVDRWLCTNRYVYSLQKTERRDLTVSCKQNRSHKKDINSYRHRQCLACRKTVSSFSY